MNYLPSTILAADAIPGLEDPQVHLQRNLRLGLIVIGVLLFGLVVLGGLIGINGAVIGSGEVTVESRIKKIAHPTGGVIAAVFVHEGDRVKKGASLMRLDTTVAGVNASMSGLTLQQLYASKARLTAERDGSPAIEFPPELAGNPGPAAKMAMDEANRLFALQRQADANEQAQIHERIHQTEREIGSLQAQAQASRKQRTLITPELAGLRQLHEKGLVTINRLNQMERTAVELDGGTASYDSQIAQARAKIAEIRQSGFQLDQDAKTKAGQELSQVLSMLNDQKVRSVTAQDTLDRSILRAPHDGVIDKLAYSTIGGVIPPAQTIMEVVPDNDNLTVETKISTADIDQMRIGQPATLHFSAFNAQTTPQLNGKVTHVAADRTTDERTGVSYYKVIIEVSPAELARLGALKLVPGMPVETFVQTGERSLLSYLTKPLRDQFSRAFREN
ncbi:MAG: HlyD family type I secretion periplasmic adaptor subunit [Sphingobium sp.]